MAIPSAFHHSPHLCQRLRFQKQHATPKEIAPEKNK